jgi:hypothetical protein
MKNAEAQNGHFPQSVDVVTATLDLQEEMQKQLYQYQLR